MVSKPAADKPKRIGVGDPSCSLQFRETIIMSIMPEINVLLIGNYEPDGSESMKNFASLLSSGLANQGANVRTLKPATFMGRIPLRSQELRKWLGQIDKLILFPRQLRSELDWADIVHICDHSNAVYTKLLKQKQHLVTCHDVLAIASSFGIIPEHKTRWSGKRLQSMILRGLHRADHIVCVSSETRNQLLALSTINPDQITIVRNGLHYSYSPMPQLEADRRLCDLGLLPGNHYLLHVGSNQWYKNRLAVVKAFKLFRERNPDRGLKLVMAGKPWTKPMREFVQESRLNEHVAEIVSPTNEELRALYSGAALLLFPSLREGFGWPVIEAQACGCPVLTSNRAPMTEIAGSAAVFVDPEDLASIACGILEGLSRSTELRQLGFENSRGYSKEAMLDSYMAIYRKLLLSSTILGKTLGVHVAR